MEDRGPLAGTSEGRSPSRGARPIGDPPGDEAGSGGGGGQAVQRGLGAPDARRCVTSQEGPRAIWEPGPRVTWALCSLGKRRGQSRAPSRGRACPGASGRRWRGPVCGRGSLDARAGDRGLRAGTDMAGTSAAGTSGTGTGHLWAVLRELRRGPRRGAVHSVGGTAGRPWPPVGPAPEPLCLPHETDTEMTTLPQGSSDRPAGNPSL